MAESKAIPPSLLGMAVGSHLIKVTSKDIVNVEYQGVRWCLVWSALLFIDLFSALIIWCSGPA